MAGLSRSTVSRRRLLGFGMGTLGIAALAACGPAPVPTPTAAPKPTAAPPPPTAAPPPPTAAPPPPTAAAAPPTAVPAAPAAAKPATSATAGKVLFWHYNDVKHTPIMDTISASFAKANAGLTVEMVNPTGDVVQKTQAAVAGGAGPDSVYADLNTVPTYWKAGLLAPLDDYIKSEKVDLKDYFDAFLVYSFQDGKYFSLPFEGNMPFFLWNKSLFEQNGLDPEKGPTSWEDVITFAKKTTAADKNQWGFQLPAVAPTAPQIASYVAALMWQQEGDFLKPDSKGLIERGLPGFNNDLGVAAWGFFVDMIVTHKAATLTPPANSFASGLVGMQFLFASGLPDMKKTIADKFKIGVTHFPPRKRIAGHSGGAHVAMVQASKQKDQTLKFITHMLGRETQLLWTTTSGFTAARKSVIEDSEYKAWVQKNPDYTVVEKLLPNLKPRPPIPFSNDILIAAGKELEPALRGAAGVKQSLDAGVEAVIKLYKEKGYTP